MNLHNQIMNLPCKGECEPWANTREAYWYGHKEARHAAAELALEADTVLAVACKHAASQAAQIREQRELIEQLAHALGRVCNHGRRTSAQIDADWDNARAALSAVREYRNG